MLDHKYIDDNSMAERYLRHALTASERRDFEQHLVDCQECADRLLLAEMFLLRNGTVRGSHGAPTVVEKPAFAKPASAAPAEENAVTLPAQRLPLRARIAARLSPWQLLILFVITALILVSIPALGVWLQERLHR